MLLAACGFCVLGVYGGVNVVLANFYPNAPESRGIGWAKSIGRVGTVIVVRCADRLGIEWESRNPRS